MNGKVTTLTSKDLLIEIYGVEAVQTYEAVKVGAMRLGDTLARLLCKAVDGRIGRNGEDFDGLTPIGRWEFCLQANTKNHAGNTSDLLRAPGRCVQILGQPRAGWISAEEFLEMHGKPPDMLLDILDELREQTQIHSQARLPF